MRVSDYIVEFLAAQGVRHLFGYQGTNVCYLVDSIARNHRVSNHSCYNEQGAAFAACGFAQVSGRVGVAYATSGPGAANLLSGLADAYFDSLPVLFLTGQINTDEYNSNVLVRQHSFQEMDVVHMAAPVAKYATQVTDALKVRYELEKAWCFLLHGRPGPVLLDIPMDVQRAEITPDVLEGFLPDQGGSYDQVDLAVALSEALSVAHHPVLVVGSGVSRQAFQGIYEFAQRGRIPIVTSVLARHLMTAEDPLNFGYIGGAYGSRQANIIAAAKGDLLIAIGISLCSRQIGVNTPEFARGARLLRIDIEPQSALRRIKPDEVDIRMDALVAAGVLASAPTPNFAEWLSVCVAVRDTCVDFDSHSEGREPNSVIAQLSSWVPVDTSISVDVGQHMMWTAQSFKVKSGQRLLFSGGHGAMGYAIPAAIGAWYCDKRPVYCLAGDGGFQMNIQELAWIAREAIPVKIVVLNNSSLGMVRFQQTDLFAGRYEGTATAGGYSTPDFVAIAKAYGIEACRIEWTDDIEARREWFQSDGPRLMDIVLPERTAAYPKTHFGSRVFDQDPRLPAELLEHLLSL